LTDFLTDFLAIFLAATFPIAISIPYCEKELIVQIALTWISQ